jgi:hypothetical protein
MAAKYPQAYKIICTIIVWIKLKLVYSVIGLYEENTINLLIYLYFHYGDKDLCSEKWQQRI